MLAPTIIKHFSVIPDPRLARSREHKLVDVLVIAVVGALCGAEGFEAIERIAKAKEDWLKGILELRDGIPSHDTIARVLSRISPKEFELAFASWMKEVASFSKGSVVAIDGKTLRRSHDRKRNRSAIHMVSAFASANGVVLGQMRVDGKSNETAAIPELLKILDLAGCLVTIDAAGCQKKIAQAIIDKKADYVLALRGNQSKTMAAGNELFEDAKPKADMFSTFDEGHGRSEMRVCKAVDARKIEKLSEWPGCRSAVRIVSRREIDGKETREIRFTSQALSRTLKDCLRPRVPIARSRTSCIGLWTSSSTRTDLGFDCLTLRRTWPSFAMRRLTSVGRRKP